jgi:microsomal dipeptidase-like Zn-dependent dipeptidase/gamma-glutamyl-gamma-aminobutyrate hydrolase PuuD
MVIGLSVSRLDGRQHVGDAYVEAVAKTGATPAPIPLTTDAAALEASLDGIDGLVMVGGGDLYSPLFGEDLHPAVTAYDIERDRYDLELVKAAVRRQLPVLGICRGMQVLNVAFGGNLIQDIPSQRPGSQVRHRQDAPRAVATHTVRVRHGSRLRRALSGGARGAGGRGTPATFAVNSFHHQAVKDVAPGFRGVAASPDGVVEAMESAEGKAILGVQWHPEDMAVAGDRAQAALFHDLAGEAELFRRARELHKKIYSIDSHVDTPMLMAQGVDIGKRDARAQVDLPKMRDGLLDAVFMAAYIPQGPRTVAASDAAYKKTVSIIDWIKKQVERNGGAVALARSSADLKRNKAAGKKTVFIGIENGYAIGKDVGNVERFARMGAMYITLTHNGDNDICGSNQGKGDHGGLSEFGKAVVREMNRVGIIVDVSHTSEQASFDVLKVSKLPVIASHSSAKALRDHPRNVSDKLIDAIAKNGGVVQVCLYGNFLKRGGKATVKDAVDHIDHIAKRAGIDHVGVASDFDGGGGITGLNAANEYPQLTMELLRRGYSDADIAKIWGGNILRVMDAVRAGGSAGAKSGAK